MCSTLAVAAAVVSTLAAPAVAVPPPGTPPAGLSPVAASVYRGQFALCALQTLGGLAHRHGVSIEGLTTRAAAARLAQNLDADLGTAPVRGCRAGLLYRARNDGVVAGLRRAMRNRLTAEKYVAAVYGFVVVVLFSWLLMHVAKIARLERRSADLVRMSEERARADASSAKAPA